MWLIFAGIPLNLSILVHIGILGHLQYGKLPSFSFFKIKYCALEMILLQLWIYAFCKICVIRMKSFLSKQKQLRFATLTKHVNNQTKCRIALKKMMKIWSFSYLAATHIFRWFLPIFSKSVLGILNSRTCKHSLQTPRSPKEPQGISHQTNIKVKKENKEHFHANLGSKKLRSGRRAKKKKKKRTEDLIEFWYQ